MASTNPARGMRDFLPADIRKRNYVINIIKEVYESYGFEPLETPAVENLETLMGKYGDEGNQLVFKILKRGEKLDLEHAKSESDLSDLALRYDLTVPLARVVANNKNELPNFFKRYQIQPVWRADRPARGRFREFYQCDVDAIGSSSMVVEAELISAVGTILRRLKFKDYIIKLNHRDLLFHLLDLANVPKASHEDALIAIDKLDKIPAYQVEAEMVGKGVNAGSASVLIDLYTKIDNAWKLGYDNNPILVSEVLSDDNEAKNYLLQLLNLLPCEKLTISPFLARGLAYYSGTIMEIVLTDGDFKGSIGGGGRYDGLIGMFGKEQIPACGFSLGLERILVVMEERGMFPPEIAESVPADVMVTIWSEETVGESLNLAAELRKGGLRVTVYPEADKLGRQIKYADSIKVPFVCVLGESELAEKKVTLKNMKTGEQETISRSEVIEALRK